MQSEQGSHKGIRRTPICVQNKLFPQTSSLPQGRALGCPKAGAFPAPRRTRVLLGRTLPCRVCTLNPTALVSFGHLQQHTAEFATPPDPERRPHLKVSPSQRRWNGHQRLRQRHGLICHPNFHPTLSIKPNPARPALPKGRWKCRRAAAGPAGAGEAQ